MPRVDKADVDSLGNSDFLSHGTGTEPLQAAFRVIQIVDGLHRLLSRPGGLPGLPLGLLHLDMGAVLQHNGAEIRRLLRGVDPAPEAVLRNQRQKS